MSKKSIIFCSIIFLLALVGAGYYFVWPRLHPSAPVAIAVKSLFGWKFPSTATKFPSTGSAAGGDLAYATIRDPGGIPQGLPVSLAIPIIGVDSPIEDALITPDGRMDVPSGTVDVAWFALGPHPGQVGSAVIGGHYGIQNGVPFVFFDLNKLKIGDKVYVTNDEGKNIEFVVRSIKSFAREADATTVFTSTDGLAHLNLITCEGSWNEVSGNYPDRLVIFTDLVSSSATIPTSTQTSASTSTPAYSIATFARPLSIGSTGAEVITLQTYLEQRGLLSLPKGVSNGYFGTLTSAAVSSYQASIGLPQVGVFGPLTMAKLNSDMVSKTVLPNTGTDATSSTSAPTPVPTSMPSVFTQFLESSYSSVFNGLVTSVLILAILFVAIKIIL